MALLRHRQALEESSRLTRQYQDRYLYSFDNLKLHAYLCMNGKSGNPKQTDTHIGTGSQTGTGIHWVILVHGYADSGLWFHEEADRASICCFPMPGDMAKARAPI